jgi:hypothetical protein
MKFFLKIHKPTLPMSGVFFVSTSLEVLVNDDFETLVEKIYFKFLRNSSLLRTDHP